MERKGEPREDEPHEREAKARKRDVHYCLPKLIKLTNFLKLF